MSERGLPMSGVRVVDFTRVFSGPFATQVFGDLGADVVKVERVDGGDEARDYGKSRRDGTPGGPPFLAMNRNKRSVAMDVKRPAGLEVAERLITTADVVIENFRPAVMDRLGLGYERASRLNPRVVYCSISGFGSEGPLAGRAANDLSIQAQSGLLSMTGEPGRQPVRTPAPLGDLTAGMFAAIGVLAALLERSSSGRGQHVETSMLAGQVSTLNYFFVDYWLNGVLPRPMGTANGLGLPNQAFPTTDGWVCITSSNERAWQRLCTALEIEDAATDPRFADLRSRYAHREEVVDLLTQATEKLSTSECVRRLDAHGVSNAPVKSLAEAAADPQLEAMGMTTSASVPGLGDVRLVTSPLRMSAAPSNEPAPPPPLGQDTRDVLAELGYSDGEQRRLRADGVVAW